MSPAITTVGLSKIYGKTTTILNLLRPSDGVATVLGLDSVKDSVAIKDRIGYVPGDLATWESMTARQFLEYLGRKRNTARAES